MIPQGTEKKYFASESKRFAKAAKKHAKNKNWKKFFNALKWCNKMTIKWIGLK
jgi:hypothetical protein